MSASHDALEETEEQGRRWQKRDHEGEHQTGKKRRKYDDNYLGLGFTWIGDTDYLICFAAYSL